MEHVEESLIVVTPKVKGFICTTAHPEGCRLSVQEQIAYAKRHLPPFETYRRALVIGASAGFGLASRIALAVSGKASTMGVYFERAPKGKRTGSAGWYATKEFEKYCKQKGIYHSDFDGNAFSTDIKDKVVDAIKKELGQLDLLIYSLAAPRRVHPETGVSYASVLKTVNKTFSSKTIDLMTGEMTRVDIAPATTEEIEGTTAVMGGDDWKRWVNLLLERDLLAQNFISIAYSYIGSEITWPIYRDGAIGHAKRDLENSAKELRTLLKPLGGNAFVSVNKALVTQASSAIPVVPLYLSLLYKIMKEKGIHEDCIQQVTRLFKDRLINHSPSTIPVDEEGRIRIDDLELRADVQEEILRRWAILDESNLHEIADLDSVRRDYLKVFGFEFDGINYEHPVDIAI